MGFSFRRSSSFGPSRLNFSKSGIGASVGVKSARVTLSPRGRTYILAQWDKNSLLDYYKPLFALNVLRQADAHTSSSLDAKNHRRN